MSMSNADQDEMTTETDADRADEDDRDRLELAAQAELLEEENQRLQAEYARARQSQYRRTAAGLALVGVLAGLAGLVFADVRDVLFSLAAVGLFGGVLTYYVTPETFIAAGVGEQTYAALARNEASIAAELGLTDDRVYVPTDTAEDVRLYIPQRTTDELPDITDRSGPIATDPDQRGLVLEPTGAGLFESFERTLTDDLATAPEPLAMQLTDGLVEQFELADSAESDVDASGGRVTVAIVDSAFGAVDRFDHPIASFLAVGFGTGLERPIRLEVTAGDDRSDWLVTCRWDFSVDEQQQSDLT
ncbi:hypothetical protein C488_15717 [Natrinema pellirubrum DSM 15624]|uniref:DUF7982 domain-containing protein n=1 Tax=Natrinema pellirubrum (strain DSM 15624 / CIP 106293 / JCM 10476 / NCIMB 786 / 157) TaxID=797303 RepID=L0JSY4_NATP1|nr:hypothetical protein [Natrinema pellirubrum]AGB33757.1 hypothetical protein Natpe_4029 [Natrinema pellirubrum DSM 15624]ELY71984.1 hypothetical protein C488_15717 [Natrinema pellirubrum DSM 15624]